VLNLHLPGEQTSLFLTSLPETSTQESVRVAAVNSLPFLEPSAIRNVVHVAKTRFVWCQLHVRFISAARADMIRVIFQMCICQLYLSDIRRARSGSLGERTRDRRRTRWRTLGQVEEGCRTQARCRRRGRRGGVSLQRTIDLRSLNSCISRLIMTCAMEMSRRSRLM